MPKANHHGKLPEGTEVIDLTALSPVEKQVVLMHKEKLAGVNKELQGCLEGIRKELQGCLESIKKALVPSFQARFDAVAADLTAYATSIMELRDINPDDYIVNADKLVIEPKPKTEETKAEQPVTEVAPIG